MPGTATGSRPRNLMMMCWPPRPQRGTSPMPRSPVAPSRSAAASQTARRASGPAESGRDRGGPPLRRRTLRRARAPASRKIALPEEASRACSLLSAPPPQVPRSIYRCLWQIRERGHRPCFHSGRRPSLPRRCTGCTSRSATRASPDICCRPRNARCTCPEQRVPGRTSTSTSHRTSRRETCRGSPSEAPASPHKAKGTTRRDPRP